MATKSKIITQKINQLQRRYPGTRRQRSYHGAGVYSVQFFDKKTGRLVADHNLSENPSVRTAPKSAIPAKFVTAKVRRVGSKVQILLNK